MRWWISLTLDLPPGAQQLVEETAAELRVLITPVPQYPITPTIANNRIQQSQHHRATRGGAGARWALAGVQVKKALRKVFLREIKEERHCSGAKAFKVKGKVPRQKEA